MKQQQEVTIQQLIFSDPTTLTEVNVPVEWATDGLPVPAAALRYLVAGTIDVVWFLASGKLAAETVTDLLGRHGITWDQAKRVLDLGCGCGRVLRHFKSIAGVTFYGRDCNTPAIRWCKRYLGDLFDVNALEPPLKYDKQSFDLIYAFSIFTHLTEALQIVWMSELPRILVSKGHLIISIRGNAYRNGLSSADRKRYNQGHLVVKEPHIAGSNYCNAYHPEDYVRRSLAREFEVIDFIPEGAKGNPPQDVYLLRKKSEGT